LFCPDRGIRQRSNSQSESLRREATRSLASPIIDGAAGPCSLELTILGADAKPVYNATVKVHITYGFGGFHHLDLQAGTNSDGKVKFTGIPAKVHNPPLEFDATKDGLEGSVNFDPLNECQGKHDVKLEKPKAQDQQ
jgi:hypothetical protein